MISNDAIVSALQGRLNDAHSPCSQVHTKAIEGQEYLGGEQWNSKVKRARSKRGMPSLVFDKIGPFIMTLTSKAVMNRFTGRIMADGPEDVIAEPLDKFVRATDRRANAEFVEADTFRDMLAQGVACCSRQVKYINGRAPRIVITNVPIWEAMWDPAARAQNLSDRMWHAVGRYVPESHYRGISAVDFHKFGVAKGLEYGEDSWGWPQDLKNSYISSEGQIFVTEYEWKEMEPAWDVRLPVEIDQIASTMISSGVPVFRAVVEAINQVSVSVASAPEGESALSGQNSPLSVQLTKEEWLGEDGKAGIQSIFGINFPESPPLDAVEIVSETYYFAKLVGDQVISSGQIPEKAFTYLFMSDYLMKSPNHHTIRSFVSEEIDRQDFINVCLSGHLAVASKSPKGGFLVTTNSVPRLEEFKANVAAAGAVVEVNNLDGVREMKSVPWTGYMDAMKLATQAMQETTLDPYSTGASGDLRRVASRVLDASRADVLGKHSGRLQALTLYRQAAVRLSIGQAAAYWSDEDMAAVVGGDFDLLPSDRRAWIAAMDREVVVDDGEMTQGQRDERWERLFAENRFLEVLAGMGPQYLPSPGTFSEMIPKFMGAKARMRWAKDLENAQAMMDAQMQAAQQQQQQQENEQPPQEGGEEQAQ